MYDPGTAAISIGSRHSLGYITFECGNSSYTERMRIKNDGDIAIFNSHLSGSAGSTGSFGKVTIGGPVFNDVSASRHSALTIHSPSGAYKTGSAITIVGDNFQGRQRINWDMDGDDKVFSYIEARGQGGGDNRGELYFGTRNGGRDAFEAVPRMGISKQGRVTINGTYGQAESQVAGGKMNFNSASLAVFSGNTNDNVSYAGWFENRVDASDRHGIYVSTIRDGSAIIRAAQRTFAGAETKVFEVTTDAKISGSAISTGSFGMLDIVNNSKIFGDGVATFGTGSRKTTYADGYLDFGVKGDTSNGRVVFNTRYMEVGNTDHWTGNVYTKGAHNETLYVQNGIWIGSGNGHGTYIKGPYTGDQIIGHYNTGAGGNLIITNDNNSGYGIIFKTTTSSTTERMRITDSGSVVFSGANQLISGSSTSTGSFGRVVSPGTGSFGRVDSVGRSYFTKATIQPLLLLN